MTDLTDYPKFKEHIWDNPSFCNNCYRRVKQVVPISGEEYRNSLESAFSDSVHYRTDDGVIGYRIEQREGEAAGIYYATTSCGVCGSVGCVSIPDDVDRRTLLERLDRIVMWLEKMDVDPEEDVMRAVVHERKRESESQGRDPEILAEAVERGL